VNCFFQKIKEAAEILFFIGRLHSLIVLENNLLNPDV